MRPYRERAFEMARRMGIDVVAMEYYRATSAVPVEQCLQAVAESDVLILILGFRYGFVPKGFDKSITELEYEEARSRGIPILAFFLSDDVPIKRSSIEDNPQRASQLDTFKQGLLRTLIAGSIETPDQFSAQLASSLHALLSKKEPFEERPRSSLERQLEVCREEGERYKRVIDDLNAKLQRIVPADPIWKGRKFDADSLTCFALMPFKDPHFEIYETAIVPAVEKQGLRALHAGEIFGNREIVEDIWDSICSARIIVADVTGRNPNVFYELGICHTLGKECIVITQNREDVPFDIRHRRFLEYDPTKLTSLRSNLGKTIQAVLTNNNSNGSDA